MQFLVQLTTFFKEELIDKFPNENYVINLKEKYKKRSDKEEDVATYIS